MRHIAGRRLMQIHILVHKMQKVIAVRLGGVAQVDDRHMVSVVSLGDAAVVTVQVPFRVRG